MSGLSSADHAMAPPRVEIPREYNAENEPLCGSDDGLVPRPEYIGAVVKIVGKDAAGRPRLKPSSLLRTCVHMVVP